MKKLFLSMAMATLLAACDVIHASPTNDLGLVRIESGLVRGNSQDGLHSFLGIPYAAAPVGELRWRAPHPVKPWSGVRDGSAFGPDCMQPDQYPELRGHGMSEDCLSVNVWSPAKNPGKNLPVMVWIYGGSYLYGSGSLPSYEGAALARRGVVVVNLNYRMGLFGFMAHPELTAESPTHSSGNYALMDQIAALKWVKRNIAAFGGDPNKVTLFGQSAGAHSVAALIASPLADGLFQQAAMQSVVGIMRPMPTLKEAEAYGLGMGSSIKDLRKLSASEIVDRLRNDPPPQTLLTHTKVLNIISDGNVVREADFKPYGKGHFQRVPLLVGSVSNEGGGSSRSNSSVKTVQQWREYLAKNFPGMEEQAIKVYGVERDDQVPQAFIDLYSDTQFLFTEREVRRAANGLNVPVYRYVFSRHRFDEVAAAPIHGDELQYVFDTLETVRRGSVKPFNETDSKVASTMADAWVRFAKTGSPAGCELKGWPAYEPEKQAYMDFDSTPIVRNGADTPRMALVRAYYASKWH